MRSTWKTVRIFISSTFRDMHAERDYLIRFVFPRLRACFQKYRIHIDDVDLRWGVTSDQNAVSTCRSIIDDCRPRFLCLLGGRYGTIPDGFSVSITEDEIEYGALGGHVGRADAFFYFRRADATATVPAHALSDFCEPADSIEAQKVAQLKGRICGAGFKPYEYTCRWNNQLQRFVDLETLGEQVYCNLERSIRNDAALAENFSVAGERDEDFDEESAQHLEIDQHCSRFLPGSRKFSLEVTAKHAASGEGPNYLCWHAPSGIGKSALLASFCQDFADAQQDTVLLSHFVGASPKSMTLSGMLRRLYLAACSATGATSRPPQTLAQLDREFRERLMLLAKNRRVVIVIDAADQIDEYRLHQSLSWLWGDLPANVRVVMGLTEERALEAIEHAGIQARVESLPPLHMAEVEAIIDQFLKRYGKSLDNDQRAHLLQKDDIQLPLYLLAALEELRTLGLYSEITERIAELPGRLDNLIQFSFGRLANDPGFRDAHGNPVGAQIVARVCGLLAASRSGLADDELRKLTQSDEATHNVDALLRLLRPYLTRRGPLVDFQQRVLREVAGRLFVADRPAACTVHRDLADYFEQRGWAYSRSLSELPHHLFQLGRAADDQSRLLKLLDDGCDFIEQKWRNGRRLDDVDRDFRLGMLACREQDQWEKSLPLVVRSSSFRGLAALLNHGDLIIATTPAADLDDVIGQLESGALLNDDILQSATQLVRLALAIQEQTVFDSFCRRVTSRLGDWVGDRKLSADHAAALSAALLARGSTPSADRALSALSSIENPRIRFSGCRLLLNSAHAFSDQQWSSLAQLLWDCGLLPDQPTDSSQSEQKASKSSAIEGAEEIWMEDLKPVAVWYEDAVDVKAILKLIDAQPPVVLPVLLKEAHRLPPFPTPPESDASNAKSSENPLAGTAGLLQSLFGGKGLSGLGGLLGNLDSPALKPEEPKPSEDALRFLQTALRIADSAAFEDVCSQYCEGDWLRFGQYVVSQSETELAGLAGQPAEARQRLLQLMQRALAAADSAQVANDIKLRLGLFARTLGGRATVCHYLRAVVEKEFGECQVAGILSLAKSRLYPERNWGRQTELVHALEPSEAAEQLHWLLRQIPAFVPDWFVLDVIRGLIPLVQNGWNPEQDSDGQRADCGELVAVLDQLLELLAQVADTPKKSLCVMQLAALGTFLTADDSARGFFSEFNVLARKHGEDVTEHQAVNCLEALAANPRLVAVHAEEIVDLITRRWTNDALKKSDEVQINHCRLLLLCGRDDKFDEQLVAIANSIESESFHLFGRRLRSLAQLAGERPGVSRRWRDFVTARIPRTFEKESDARTWCDFVAQCFVDVPFDVVELILQRFVHSDLSLGDALEIAENHAWIDRDQLLGHYADATQIAVNLPDDAASQPDRGDEGQKTSAFDFMGHSSLYESRSAGRNLRPTGLIEDFDYDGRPKWIHRAADLIADPWMPESFGRMKTPDGSIMEVGTVTGRGMTASRRISRLLPDELATLAPHDRARYIAAIITRVLDDSEELKVDCQTRARFLLARISRLTQSVDDPALVAQVRGLVDHATRHSLQGLHIADYCESVSFPLAREPSRLDKRRLADRFARDLKDAPSQAAPYLRAYLAGAVCRVLQDDELPLAVQAVRNELATTGLKPGHRCLIRLNIVATAGERIAGEQARLLFQECLHDLADEKNDFVRFEAIRQLAGCTEAHAQHFSVADVDRLVDLVLEPEVLVGTEHLRGPAIAAVAVAAASLNHEPALGQLWRFYEDYLGLKDAQARVLHTAGGDPSLRDEDLVTFVRSLSELLGRSAEFDLSNEIVSRTKALISNLQREIKTPLFKILALPQQLVNACLTEQEVNAVIDHANQLIEAGGIYNSEFTIVWGAFTHSHFRGRQVLGPHWLPVVKFVIQFMGASKDMPMNAYLFAHSIPEQLLSLMVQGCTTQQLRDGMHHQLAKQDRGKATAAAVRVGLGALEDDWNRIGELEAPRDRAWLYRVFATLGLRSAFEQRGDWLFDQFEFWSRQPPSECLGGLTALVRLANQCGWTKDPAAVARQLVRFGGDEPLEPAKVESGQCLLEYLKLLCRSVDT